LKFFLGLADAFEAEVAAKHNHGFKKQRRVLASARAPDLDFQSWENAIPVG
jgi:hypothetical protein